jgi:hypothetical protein
MDLHIQCVDDASIFNVDILNVEIWVSCPIIVTKLFVMRQSSKQFCISSCMMPSNLYLLALEKKWLKR